MTKIVYNFRHNQIENLILTCKHCGIQYVGQTVVDFRYRRNNYKDNCRKHSRNEDCMQKHLYDHYLSCSNDFLNMVSVTFIDKTDPSKRENSTGDISYKPTHLMV